MNWHSWGEFVAMSGYGLSVWGAVLVVLAAIVVEVVEVAWCRRAILSELKSLEAES